MLRAFRPEASRVHRYKLRARSFATKVAQDDTGEESVFYPCKSVANHAATPARRAANSAISWAARGCAHERAA